MSYYPNIIARSTDIWAVASSRVKGFVRGASYARRLSRNVHAEADRAGVSYRELRRRSGIASVRFARMWFCGEGSVSDLYRVQRALGSSVEAIWSQR